MINPINKSRMPQTNSHSTGKYYQRKILGSFLALSVSLQSLVGCGDIPPLQKIEDTTPPPTPATPILENKFLHVCGASICDKNEQEIKLTGLGMQNNTWDETLETFPAYMTTEEDLSYISNLGANTIRFYLSYKWFENDANPYIYKEQIFKDLENLLYNAAKQNLYIILDMHITQGGNQAAGEGDIFWTTAEYQNRYIQLWKEIALRFKDNPTVAGYEIMNEPHPPTDNAWKTIAEKTVSAIREIDQNHIIFVCNSFVLRNNGVDDYSNYPIKPFTVNDSNIVYAIHSYDPFPYAANAAPEIVTLESIGARYPDKMLYHDIVYTGGYYPSGNKFLSIYSPDANNWNYFEGDWITPGATSKFAQAAIGSHNESGKVWFKGIKVEEKCADEVKTIELRNRHFDSPLYISGFPDYYLPQLISDTSFFPDFWTFSKLNRDYYYSGDTTKSGIWLDYTTQDDLGFAIVMNNCEDCQTVSYLPNNYFILQQGCSYRISGYMKGENLGVIDSSTGECDYNAFMLNFFSGGIEPWDKNHLEAGLKIYADWAAENKVPLILTEWGVVAQNEEADKMLYIDDVTSLLLKYNISSTFHNYIDQFFVPGFGLITIDPETLEVIDKDQARIDSLAEYFKQAKK